MFLTKDVFHRKFVIKELEAARKFGLSVF